MYGVFTLRRKQCLSHHGPIPPPILWNISAGIPEHHFRARIILILQYQSEPVMRMIKTDNY